MAGSARRAGQPPEHRRFGAPLSSLVATTFALALAQAAPSAHSAPRDAPSEIDRLITAYDYAGAERVARDLLSQAAAGSEENSLATAAALDTLVSVLVLKKEGISPEPVDLARRAVEIKEHILGSEHQDVAPSLHCLGDALHNAGDYRGARSAHERALAIRERAFGPSHLLVAESIDHLLWTLTALWLDPEMKDLQPRMEALANRAIQIKEQTYGPAHPALGRSLDNLGFTLLIRAKDLEGSRSAHQRALEIRERALGPDHLDVAESLNFVSVMTHVFGDEPKSNAQSERALAIRERILGSEHPDTAWNLGELAVGHFHLGRYEESLQMHERAVRINEKALGPDHPETAWSRRYLAEMLYWLGDYTEAERHFRQSLAALEKSRGPQSTWTQTVEAGLAQVLMGTGDYARAGSIFERTDRDFESTFGSDYYPLAIGFLAHAKLRQRTGEIAYARSLLERALSIFERALGPRHYRTGWAAQYLADLLADTPDKARARELCERSIRIFEESYGPETYALAASLDILARLESTDGHQQRARLLLERAQRIKEGALGQDHPEVAATLLHLARALARAGDRAGALAATLRAEEIGREHLRLTARDLPERQALRYASIRPSGMDLALSLAAGAADPRVFWQAWDALIRGRAAVLDEMAGRHRSLSASEEPEVVRLSERLRSMRTRLANLTIRGPGEGPAERYRVLLEDLTAQKEEIERSLTERSLTYRERRAAGEVGLPEVIRALPPRTALVAYARYEHSESGSTAEQTASSYLAMVLGAGDGAPAVVPLGGAATIDSLIRHWRSEVALPPRGSRAARARADAMYRTAGDRLRRAIWDPLAEHMKDARTVFLVPDGMIHLVSFATLPAGEDLFLAERPPVLHYFSAERDISGIGRRGRTSSGVLVMGGPDFEAEPRLVDTEALARAATPDAPALVAAASGTDFYRSPGAECADLQSLRFEPLPGSRAEVEEIAVKLAAPAASGQASKEALLALTGPAAGEGAFKRLALRSRVLHIATHGFALQGRCRSSLDAGVPPVAGASARTATPAPGTADNPLLLSGLALAGANRRNEIKGDTVHEDGILTAEEIGSLDLSGVEWAVLSACETGLGDARAGEGVLGLRRAFQVAGARTLIMSLWQVQDQATREWMGALYQNRSAGMMTSEAVSRAGLDVIEQRRRDGRSTHPFYWGAFVAAGDYR